MKTTVKSAVIGLFTLAAVTFGLDVKAGNETPGAELISAGKLNNQPVFQLNINNKENAKYAVVIKDDAGDVIYQEVLTGVNISRKFQLNAEDFAGTNVRFEIIDLKSSTVASAFNVKDNQRIVNETDVVKK
ncbi:MAG: hypothetical protein QM725_03155 [Lacibacter sp.]